MEELKTNVTTQIEGLKTDLNNTINFRSQINPTFHIPYPPNPPTDDELPELEKRIRKTLQQILYEKGVPSSEIDLGEMEVRKDTLDMFKARYGIEKELRRIWHQRFAPNEFVRPAPINHLINNLLESGIIDKRIGDAIREVYSVTSPAVHGAIISNDQVQFVRDVAPELIATLKAIS